MEMMYQQRAGGSGNAGVHRWPSSVFSAILPSFLTQALCSLQVPQRSLHLSPS